MTGHAEYLKGRRDAVLSTARISDAARARIMGRPIHRAPAKVHAITVDCAKPDERKVEVGDPVSPPKRRARQRRISIPAPTLSSRGGGYGGGTVPAPDIDAVSKKARDIIHVACTVFAVDVESVLSVERSRKYARPRQAAMSLMAKLLKLSQPAIGRIFTRDHSTVTYAVTHKVPELLATERGFRVRYAYATRKIRRLWGAP